jgi:hypothetical protein
VVSCSSKIFVAGVDEKLMAYLEGFDINADALLSDSKSEELSFDSSKGIVPNTPPKISEEETTKP